MKHPLLLLRLYKIKIIEDGNAKNLDIRLILSLIFCTFASFLVPLRKSIFYTCIKNNRFLDKTSIHETVAKHTKFLPQTLAQSRAYRFDMLSAMVVRACRGTGVLYCAIQRAQQYAIWIIRHAVRTT
jgi:hypothetical protein